MPGRALCSTCTPLLASTYVGLFLCCRYPPVASLLLQTHDSIQWWGGLCTWGANFCSKHKWAWFCGLTLQYCQVQC
jgi:hypothetical protein